MVKDAIGGIEREAMESQDKLTAELARAKRLLAVLTEEVEKNGDILQRSQQRELALLQADDLAALFKQLLFGLKESYRLDAVTVVLCDPDHDIRHLLLATGAGMDEFPGLIFIDALAGLSPQYVALRHPWLGAYSAPDHQLILPQTETNASIAMIPLQHKGKLLGSINFCSADAERFTPVYAIDFFDHLGVIASFALENAVNRARLRRSGFTDVLTGWNNRRYLQVRLVEELARARRDATMLICLMLDIDYFKRINDTFGHAAGDEVLKEIAQRIESQVRASDVAARYGGEEFVILLPNTDAASGELLAERIRTEIASIPVDIGRQEGVTVTVSIGIAGIAPQRDDLDLKTVGESLIARADVALYRAKSAGRDQIAVDTEG
ncbi:MAG: sensor domain-containing diguanylate cyclase [Proteobacteria bacterium]|nr:sensor domain-containing diguanylate cyclase [Pseudomonadota bacterium]